MDIGVGATLKLGDGSEEALVAVSPLLGLTPPDPEFGTWEYVEVDGNRVKKSIPTTDDPGDFAFECEYTAERLARLQAVRGVDAPYEIKFADNGVWAGRGILKKAGSVPGETGQVIVCSGRCSDGWTFTEPA